MIALEEKASHQFQRSREGCKNLMAVKDIMSSGRGTARCGSSRQLDRIEITLLNMFNPKEVKPVRDPSAFACDFLYA
jgi:hypothetical protein